MTDTELLKQHRAEWERMGREGLGPTYIERIKAEHAARIQSLTADLKRAKRGLEDALKCTPFIFEGQIGFDGGDPYDVIRRTLKDISHD